MNRQRFRLGEYYGQQPKYYHATFDHISHKINSQKKKIPVILLTDIFLVNDKGEKIRLAKKNDFKDKKGRHIIADHLWVKLTKEWLKLPCQLLKGDEVYFQAGITKYRISRQDVLNKRNKIWNDALKKNEQIYKRWSKYTDTHKRKNLQLSLEKMKDKQRENLINAQAKKINWN